MIKKGKERLSNDLSIEKIIKHLRDIKLIVKTQIMDEKLKFKIQYDKNNFIDIDETPPEIDLPLH